MSGSVASLYAWRGGVGWGGMLTFLVLLPLHVATLPNVTQKWPEKPNFVWVGNPQARWVWKKHCTVEWRKSVATLETIDAAWSAVKDFIPNSLCSKSKDLLLCVKCWQWRCIGDIWKIAYPSPAKNNFNAEAPALKRKKERKNLLTCPNEMNPKPTRNTNLAKFSRENLAQFGLQKCLFGYGEKETC